MTMNDFIITGVNALKFLYHDFLGLRLIPHKTISDSHPRVTVTLQLTPLLHLNNTRLLFFHDHAFPINEGYNGLLHATHNGETFVFNRHGPWK